MIEEVSKEDRQVWMIEHAPEGIREAVEVLINHDFDVYEAGDGVSTIGYKDPTVRFRGSEFDLIRAHEVCEQSGLRVFESMRVFRKVPIHDENLKFKGRFWEGPVNQIVFQNPIRNS